MPPHSKSKTQFYFILAACSLITTLTFSSVVFAQIQRESSQSILPDNKKSKDVSSAVQAGHILKSSGPSSSYQTGFDAGHRPSWSAWASGPVERIVDPYAGYKQLAYDPRLNLPDRGAFNVDSSDDEGSLMSKVDGLLNTVAGRVRLAQEQAVLDPGHTLSGMVAQSDRMFQAADGIYADVDGMFKEIDQMYAALDANYKAIEGVELTQDAAAQFNTASDAMAERAAFMGQTVEGMSAAVANTFGDIDGLLAALDHMSKDGAAASEFSGKLQEFIDGAAQSYEALAAALQTKDFETAEAANGILNYFKEQQIYLKSLKSYVQGDQLKQVEDVRKYLGGAKSYLEKVRNDLGTTRKKLTDIEAYFRKAKVGNAPSSGLDLSQPAADACPSAEIKGLKSLQECSKSCRTVCRWKSKEAGNDCYECPSGSPDSCWDIGAWPANHPWCQPGGPCHDDPMLYCSPFGTTGPNLEKLECTACKQRPDMCWQKVGDGTTTFTNCKLGCWNGKCIYKGKYQEFEWDGKSENIHCFECKTPPGPPTCEEMGWGHDWEVGCKKNCPAPGICEEVGMTMAGPKPKGPANPPAGEPEGGQKDGNGPTDGPAAGGNEGGSGATGGNAGATPSGGEGTKPIPPTGSSEQPGGGGAIAGGGTENPPASGAPTDQLSTDDGNTKPSGQPDTTHPDAPTTSERQKPDIKDTDPPVPPDTAEATWLRKWITQDNAIIDDRNKIIADPHEGDETKAEAARQVESYTKERDRVQKLLDDEQESERARLAKEAGDKARVDAGQKEYERTRTRWPDPKKVMQDIRLRELKESLTRLRTRAQEIRDALTGRKEHIDRLTHEIDLIEKEIKHHKDASESGDEDSTHAKNAIADLEKQLAQKKFVRDELAKKLQEAQRQAKEELDKLKREYQKKLYAADENTRRREEATRIDEYYDKYIELEQTKASRDERTRAFEEKFKDMESQIAAAKASGDSSTAEKLQEQLDNMKRGKEAWDKQYATRIKSIEDQLYEMGYHRNFEDGVGPSSKDSLTDKVNEYAKIVDDQIGITEKKIADLEKAWKEGKIGTSVRADGSEHVVELDNLRSTLEQLRASRAALQEKQDILKGGYKIPDDIKENIRGNTDRYAEGAKNTSADKSFAQLALESIGEEYVHNLNPAVMAKKTVAFAWGMAKGAVTVVKDLAVLGVGIADLSLELQAQALGFENGGIFGTDSTEALYGVLSTVWDNANLDGMFKVIDVAVNAIDAEIAKIEKSGDIDWGTAELGGNVAVQTVVGDAVIGAAAGKAGTLLGFTDEAADLANAAKKAGNLAEDTAEAARAAKTAGRALEDAADVTKAAEKIADDVPTPTAVRDTPEVPKGAPHDTPPTRGPPSEAKVFDNTNRLPENGRKPTQLADNALESIETNQGFRKDHAQRMNEFAQETDTYLIVRDGNPDSVKFFDDPNMMSKPMSSKAKTAKVGPNQGLVVDPTHPKQAAEWELALKKAAADALKTGDRSELKKLKDAYKKAMKSWNEYGEEMLQNGYRVNLDSGVIEYVEKLPDGTEKVITGVHGDYDLHGVYRKGPNGTMESVSFGEGAKFDANGVDVSGGKLRQQLNDKLTGGTKDMVNHGGQDDWIPDPHHVPNKPPDPPVTVFMPDGSAPVHLKNAQDMKNFYENVMNVKWPYPDPK